MRKSLILLSIIMVLLTQSVIINVSSMSESVNSIEASNTVNAVPSAPQNVQAISGNGFVYLSWSAPLSNGGSNITSYHVYETQTSGYYPIYFTVSVSSLTYNDTVTNGVTYYYVITAVNSVGESPYSTEVNATPETVPSAPRNVQPISGNDFVYLSWSTPSSTGGINISITNYTVYRSTTTGGGYISLGNVSASNSLTYNDTAVSNGETYYYVITANSKVGESPFSTQVSVTPATVPSVPLNIQVKPENGFNYISWSPPASNGGSNITSYDIYRSTTKGSGYISIGNVSASNNLTYADTSVNNGVTYYYTIIAVSSVGDSGSSATVSSTAFVTHITSITATTSATSTSLSSSSSQISNQSSTSLTKSIGGLNVLNLLTVGLVFLLVGSIIGLFYSQKNKGSTKKPDKQAQQTQKLIEKGKFKNYTEYMSAKELGASTSKQYEKIFYYNAPDYPTVLKIERGSYPDYETYVEATKTGFKNYFDYKLQKERETKLEQVCARFNKISLKNLTIFMEFEDEQDTINWLVKLPKDNQFIIDEEVVIFNQSIQTNIEQNEDDFTRFLKEREEEKNNRKTNF